MEHPIKFIDLFAGIGGIRKGFELACAKKGLAARCVFTSEIKPHAIEVLKQNHPGEEIHGDITQIDATEIPDFDFLLAGFPCQAFSSAGKRLGFSDTRGTLFFDVERILKEKEPYGFVLENVEGLVTHDREHPKDKIGRTLATILEHLKALGYKVSWKVLNAKYFGVPQERKRIYIVGTKCESPDLSTFRRTTSLLGDVLETGLPTEHSKFIDSLLAHYSIAELEGKSIKDKRGGEQNIHSWDIEMKGPVSPAQRELLNAMLKERRKKKWAAEYGIDWMDGMPLTLAQIRTFYDRPDLEEMLNDLVRKKYLRYEHPKKKVGNRREYDTQLPMGYNIVAGKMSFEISKIMGKNDIAPTLVAMDMQHLYVTDGDGVRTLSPREGLRLFGYPDDYKLDVEKSLGYDLLGNTVVVPVIAEVAGRVLDIYCKGGRKRMRLTSQEVYDKLLEEDKILELQGQIRFYLGDVDIIVRQKDVVGNIIQEWLQGWLDKRGIEYAPSENTQMPPDFFLNPEDRTKDLLEVKAFNRSASPGFDIADFRMYEEEIIAKPYMLHVDYLIFGYDMDENGIVTIKDVWLKKVWEITRRMKDWSINLQVKQNVVHKIRPGVWYSTQKGNYPMFRRMEDFISAIEEAVYQNPKTHNAAGSWKKQFLASYEQHYGVKLDIPRWSEIEASYDK